mmetsp:Transcript_47167/g.132987  ORF Transcript_47167/g.132987 Transcript_47167/m.132987 type:complete len:235 (+) Transcript_47167:865-1569(+)
MVAALVQPLRDEQQRALAAARQPGVGSTGAQQVPQARPELSVEGRAVHRLAPGDHPVGGVVVLARDGLAQDPGEAVVVPVGFGTREGLRHDVAHLPARVAHVVPVVELVVQTLLLRPGEGHLPRVRRERVGTAQELLLDPCRQRLLRHTSPVLTCALAEARVRPVVAALDECLIHRLLYGVQRSSPLEGHGALGICDELRLLGQRLVEVQANGSSDTDVRWLLAEPRRGSCEHQ